MNSKRNLMIEYKVHKTAPEVAILILIKCISQFSNVQNLKNLKHVDKKITHLNLFKAISAVLEPSTNHQFMDFS